MKECINKLTGEVFAVKIVRSEDEELMVHTEREFNIMKVLNGHPNIV